MSNKDLILPIILSDIAKTEELLTNTFEDKKYCEGYLDALKKVKDLFYGIGVKVVSTKFPDDLEEKNDEL